MANEGFAGNARYINTGDKQPAVRSAELGESQDVRFVWTDIKGY